MASLQQDEIIFSTHFEQIKNEIKKAKKREINENKKK